MKMIKPQTVFLVSVFVASCFCAITAQTTAQYPALPSETPQNFQAKTDSFNYTRREVMIPMRDGISDC